MPTKKQESDFPNIGSPATRALEQEGYTQLKQLTKLSEVQLTQLHGVGPKAVRILKEALKAKGLSFKESKAGEVSMDKNIRTHFDNIRSEDLQAQNKAYYALINATDKPVSWAYEVWDELLDGLKNKDNHVRAISSQVLANLAKSDPKEKMLKDFGKLLDVTKDEKFVTARHCLQSLWKVGVAGKKQQKIYMEGLKKRFKECIKEKNGTLIRHDILVSMKNVYNEVNDESIKEKALALIEIEKDEKYQKKYKMVWKK